MALKEIAGLAVVALTLAAPASGQGNRGQAPATATPAAKSEPANPDAVALQDFKKRVDGYVALHRKVAKDTPPMKPTEDPAELIQAREALAKRIIEARATAQQGDIFTPATAAAFRKLLVPELQGQDGKHAKDILKDDAPPAIPLKVNTKYPTGLTRPTVPAAILTNLPTLPEELEYRIIDKHLILVDVKADVIADFIQNAIK